jgi:two-component system, OmpR family, alkaline phosphatase synthesis response regulator PhoP
MKKILMAEDDKHLIELVDIHLKDINCDTTKISNGREALQKGLSQNFDLIILDIMLPDMDGFEICRQLRAGKNKTPILMLTARSEEIDKIIGLETGADDYMTKPFSVRELVARVKAILRRSEISSQNISSEDQSIEYGDLFIDRSKRKALLKGSKLDLTPKEFDLLFLFVCNPGKSYSREALLQKVWGQEFKGYEHTVNSHINRLRAKIEPDISQPVYILTTWGVGYRFTDELYK